MITFAISGVGDDSDFGSSFYLKEIGLIDSEDGVDEESVFIENFSIDDEEEEISVGVLHGVVGMLCRTAIVIQSGNTATARRTRRGEGLNRKPYFIIIRR